MPYYADAHDQNMVDAFDEDNGYEPASSPVTYLPLGAGSARWFVTETLESTGELVADVVGADEMANPFAAVGGVAGDVLGDEGRLTGVKRAIGGESPFFVNTHFLVSHGPYFSFAQSRWSTGEEQDEAWMDDFYDDSILEFDEYVEDVYAELERTGKLDDTVIIVTSDHGEDYDASKRVPLLIRLPGGEGAGSWDVNVQRLDVAPTLLELLGYEKPEWMPGTEPRGPRLDPRGPRVHRGQHGNPGLHQPPRGPSSGRRPHPDGSPLSFLGPGDARRPRRARNRGGDHGDV